jgi:hypothetical protein
MRKAPWFAVPWHGPSDQPEQFRDRAAKRALRRHAIGDLALTTASTALALPLAAARLLVSPPRLQAAGARRALAGVAVTPHALGEQAVVDLVAELGVRHLSVRVPLDDVAARQRVWRLVAALPGCTWTGVLCQDRRFVCDHDAWRRALETVAAERPVAMDWLQIGNAVNRLKWGCVSLGEYLDLVSIARSVFPARGPVRLLGSSVIDFEPACTARTLLHTRPWRLDATAALLYVDRRGGPEGRQYGYFDLRRKLALTAALVANSRRSAPRLWITEVNWPLAGTGDFAPTSPKECVSEDAAACHLTGYYNICLASRVVERVYWWQLIAPGYGLVDDREGLRRRPAFHALGRWLRAG